MIKGVNKRIIEVQETGSICFDKAIFFVKSEFSEQDDKTLEKEARRIIKQYNICDLPPQNIKISDRQKSGKKAKIFLSLISAFGGAMIFYLFQTVI